MDIRFKDYPAQGATVKYSPRLCIHAAECVRGLPEVFKPDQKPWIEAQNASFEALAQTIARCPTGALQLEAAGYSELAPEQPVFTLLENGPIYVRGQITFPNTTIQTTRFALCRCGHSENKPFCDNAHQKGFAADACRIEVQP
jgi:uncharacterized Fe-S cluster protein YjdI